MSLLGEAALAMWWNIAAPIRAEFEHWHAHEHFPERLSLPGFLRGTRWASAGEGDGMFVMYELADHATISSPEYVARLNAPTPWSTRLMPEHRQMVRSQCRVLASSGAGVARHALTLRFASRSGAEEELGAVCTRLAETLPSRPGITGAHLLRHQRPALATTIEERIRRGADTAADWVLVVCGYDPVVLQTLGEAELATERLAAHGAEGERSLGLYTLAVSATPPEVSDVIERP